MTRFLLTLVMSLLGLAVLLGLGIWQAQRLTWKQGVLADIEARISAEPVTPPSNPDPLEDRYLPVTASGTITDEDLTVLVSRKAYGAGYRVISVFETGGRRVLLDRGFIGLDAKDTPRPAVEATVTGNLHWPDEVDGFTPDPDPEAGIWFAREVPVLAETLRTEPVMIILRTTSEASPPATPLPLDSAGVPNDHLEYAITWFSLAAVWAAMAGILLWRQHVGRQEG